MGTVSTAGSGNAPAGWISSGNDTSGAATLANSLNFIDMDISSSRGVIPFMRVLYCRFKADLF